MHQGAAGQPRGENVRPMGEPGVPWTTPDEVREALERERYVADRDLAVTLFLSLRLGKPVFLVHGGPRVGARAPSHPTAMLRRSRSRVGRV